MTSMSGWARSRERPTGADVVRRLAPSLEIDAGHATTVSLERADCFHVHRATTETIRLELQTPVIVALEDIGDVVAAHARASDNAGGGPPSATPPARSGGRTRHDNLEPDTEEVAPDDAPDGPLARLRSVLGLSTDILLARGGPLLLPQPLLPFQEAGVRTLADHDRLLLADDMGLGKTIQAVTALRVLTLQRRIERALIVVPASLVTQWRREIYRWAPELRLSTIHGPVKDRAWQWRAPAHLYLTSYETLRSDFSEQERNPVARLWDLVVLDEAQKIKNADTDVSFYCKRLRRTRQWALTGTPLENRIDDLISILDFVDPEGSPRRSPFVTTGDFRAQLGRVQLRRRKADVLTELPPKRHSHLELQLTAAQRRAYERAEREGVVHLRALGQRLRVQNVLELIVRLKQICNVCPESGESSKLDDLAERVETLASEGHKALVFSQFTNADNGAHAIARRLGPNTLVYTGELSRAERDEVLDRFRSDSQVTTLVLSLLAGGQGLNLQDASYVFHFDRWWNPASAVQAEGRSHRMGQRQPVNVYSYTCQGTIEERIDDILNEKQALFDDIVDDVSIDVTTRLSTGEMYGLFGLRPPAGSESSATP